MFKTVFKMFTTTPLNRLWDKVFDIFYRVFDKNQKDVEIYDLLKSFLNYTKWKYIFGQKINVRWQKYTNKKLLKSV